MATDFLHRTFLSLGRGFQFSKEPPAAIGSAASMNNPDPWVVLGAVLHRLRSGDLDAAARLPGLMKEREEALVWNACVQMLGFAGSTALVRDTAAYFLQEPGDLGNQWYVSELMLNACGLWTVEPLLDLHAAAEDRAARRHIEHCLSTLLEPVSGPLFDGPEMRLVPDPDYPPPVETWVQEPDEAGYAALVKERLADVVGALPSSSIAVTAGAALDLLSVARRLHTRLKSGEPSSARMEWERMLLEASTGRDFSGFYGDDAQLRRLAALAIVEDLVDATGEGTFPPGQRYFFGHPVPD